MRIEFTVSIEEWEAAWALVKLIRHDETSPYGFVRLRSHGGTRYWMATDSTSAAFTSATSETGDFEVSISPAMFAAGAALATHSNELKITVTFSDQNVITVSLSGLGGEFHVEVPNYDFPDVPSRVIAGDRIGASTSMNALSLEMFVHSVSNKRDRSHLPDRDRNFISLTIREGRFTVSSSTPGIGDAWSVPATGPTDGAVSILIDPQLLIPIIDLFDPAAELIIKLPRSVSDYLMLTDGALTTLVMPMRPEHLRVLDRVEETIKKVCGPLALRRDQDGDYPLQRDLVPIYARFVSDSNPYRLQVFAVLLNDIQSNLELMVELNDLNTNLAFTRIFHVKDQVLAEADLVAETLDPEELSTVMRRIHRLAVEVTPTLSAVFGGTLVENPEVARKDGYRSAILEVETFPGTLVALNGPAAERDWQFPESIFVITGWSPQGVDLGEAAHQKANRTIAATIAEIGGRFLHGHGRSPSGDHSEPSLFAWDISAADAIEIGRRADQDAIFQVTADEVVLLSCVDDGRQSWSRLQS